MSVVHYKFTNNLEYKTITFDGLTISLGDLKRAIMAQNKSKSGGFDLEIKNAQTKEGKKVSRCFTKSIISPRTLKFHIFSPNMSFQNLNKSSPCGFLSKKIFM